MQTAKDRIRKIMGFRESEDLIWYLIRVESPLLMQIAAVLAFLIVFYMPYKSILWALVFLFSMWFHEFGHYIFFRISKIKVRILFLFPLGAVAAPVTKEEDAKSDDLPHNNLAWLMQSGLAFNVILLVLGRLAILCPVQMFIDIGKNLVFVNTFLILMNMLPIWKLDAKQLWKVIFSSLREDHEKLALTPFLVLAVSSVVIFFLVPAALIAVAKSHQVDSGHYTRQLIFNIIVNFQWWIIPLVLASGIWHSQRKDDPKLSDSPKAMTRPQIILQILVYLIIVSITLIVGTGFKS